MRKILYLPHMGKTSNQLATIERITKLGTAEKKKLVTKGRAAIAVIKSKKDEIARDFYVIGEALVALDHKGVVAALGHSSFAQLCDVDLGISASQAARLMSVVRHFSKREAEHLSAAKATSLIDLAGAIGGKTTPKGLLARGTVHVPGVGEVDVKASGAAAIARAAKKARAGKPASGRGVHLAAGDGEFIKRVRHAKVKGAVIDGIAASAKTGGRFRITGFIRDAKAIGHALVRASRD